MEVGDLRRKGFSLNQIVELTTKKVDRDAQDQTSRILAEIEQDHGNKDARHINTYGILIPNLRSGLQLRDRWKILERETSLMPKAPDLIDKNEIERLTKSFTRLSLLRKLGFAIDSTTSYPLVDWKEHKIDNDTAFEISQSPKAQHVFLVRTSIPAENELVEIREDLLWARKLKQARRYWIDTIVRERLTHPTSPAQ